jgi:hypothetical protein
LVKVFFFFNFFDLFESTDLLSLLITPLCCFD